MDLDAVVLDALREHPCDGGGLRDRLHEYDPVRVDAALAQLLQDGRVTAQYLQTLPPRTIYRPACLDAGDAGRG